MPPSVAADLIASTSAEDSPAIVYDASSRLTVVAARRGLSGRSTGTWRSYPPYDIVAVVLDGLGQPIGTPARLSTLTDTNGPFLPFIGATGFGQVFLAYGTTSGALLDRFALPAGPPGPRLSHVSVQITTPANNRTVAASFVIAGTAFDLGADAGRASTRCR